MTELWSPLEAAIPFASLAEEESQDATERVKAAVSSAIRTIKSPKRRIPAPVPAKAAAPPRAKAKPVRRARAKRRR